ncbi:TetR/AcrR family transcriptional regulator [Companilactobacillus keshanensis]|uniref:TetR/AcrR family transcriptional regulator n=1 Tax=Companilactobacillus keshanensis TaxID=2486003 RepID=A0ABW4BTC7_9LACO|nr:TetR/AcrR family transcriptional regulator [Companilactobacillus keshanensis]
MTQKRDLSAEKIIQTAKDLILNGNADAATFSNIAKKLDCKTQALYFYFKNRYELNSAITQDYLKSLTETLKDECLGYSGKEGLVKMAKVMREFGLENLSLSLLAIKSSDLTNKEYFKYIIEINSMMKRFMNVFIQDNAKQMTITRGIRGLVIGEVVSESVGLFHNPLIKNTISFEENLYKILS